MQLLCQLSPPWTYKNKIFYYHTEQRSTVYTDTAIEKAHNSKILVGLSTLNYAVVNESTQNNGNLFSSSNHYCTYLQQPSVS